MAPQLPALVYGGEVIHERHEMLSLTDMWRAAGAPDQKNPAKWRALPTTKAFVEHVGVVVGKSDNALFRSRRGGADQGTWAHWQLALTYAKYLDHDFHMWANTAVRERMEGVASVREAIAEDLGPAARRSIGGIVKAVVPGLIADALATLLPSMVEARLANDLRVAALEHVSVRELLAEHGAVQKGRGRLNRKIGRLLQDRALLTSQRSALRKCPHSGVWLYPRTFAAAFMAETGRALVLSHNDAVNRQGRLRLVQPSPPSAPT